MNRLTAADHALFVVAAGNYGPAQETVCLAGGGQGALAVGAVDGRDRLAGFSSRGPLPATSRSSRRSWRPASASPAPGQRAPPWASRSTAATRPRLWHVVRHAPGRGRGRDPDRDPPGWSPARIKAALVSTAHPAAGGDIYALGGGRLDVARAVAGTVAAGQAATSLGTVPDGSDRLVSRRMTWTNTGRNATTIRLSARLADHQGRPAPRGAVSLSTIRVRIPAGGSATVTLSLRPRLISRHPGLYEGLVVARDGAMAARTPVSLLLAPPVHKLILHATPLPGTPRGQMAASAVVVDVSDPDLFQLPSLTPDMSLFPGVRLGKNGTATLHVPDGHYWVAGEVDDLADPQQMRAAMTGQPDVAVTRDTTVTLAGAEAVPVTASVAGQPTRLTDAGVHTERGFAGQVAAFDVDYFGQPTSKPVLFAQPTGTAHTGTFRAYSFAGLTSPPSSRTHYAYDLYHPLGNRLPASPAFVVTPVLRHRLARVTDRFSAVDGSAAEVFDTRLGLTPDGFLAAQYDDQQQAGSTRIDYLSARGLSLSPDEVAPTFAIGRQDDTGLWVSELPGFRRYAPGSIQQGPDWLAEPFRPGPYSAAISASSSGCTPRPTMRLRGDIHVELVDLQDLPDGFDCLGGSQGIPEWLAATSRVMRLYRDGRPAASATHR